MITFPPTIASYRSASTPIVRGLERALWVAATVVAVVLGALIIGLTIYGFTHRDQVYSGVSVAGVDLGGLSRSEAAEQMEAAGRAYGTVPLTVTADSETFEVLPQDVGFDLDGASTVEMAFAYGRDGSLWDRSQDWMRSVLHGHETAPVVQIDQSAMATFIDGVQTAVAIVPTDASVTIGVDGPTLQPDVAGRDLEAGASTVRMGDVLRNLGSGPVALVTTVRPPAITAEALQGIVPQAAAAAGTPLLLVSPEGSWSIPASDLAGIVTVDASAATLKVDRPAVERVVTSIAAELDQPAANAGIERKPDGTLELVSGQEARAVDIAATTDAAITAIQAGTGSVPVSVVRTNPEITDEMAAAGIAEANSYLDEGLTLTWDGGRQELDRTDLLSALVIQDTGGDPFLFQFDADVLAQLATPSFDRLDDPAVDARFRLVNGEVTQRERSTSGRVVDRPTTVQAMVDAIYAREDEVAATIIEQEPTVTNEMGDDIQLPDLLAQGVTYYTESSAPRRQNVERAATLEDGWLIPPDGIFSYNELVGDIDEANGFETGFGIVADEERGGVTTAPVMGGGICQVSTTIFQAAWWSGLEVVERYQHPYWLTGYGAAPLGRTGLDAMVNIEEDWSLDLKLRNTTGNWIAFVIVADGSALTVSLMGTDPGWTVEVSEPIETARVTAGTEIEYVDSGELPVGEELQVETANDGFTVRIDRTVRDREGNEILSDSISSEYAPSRNLVLRGTGS
ncbi:MAG TPA: VanW family protein [Thermomicrobiales bacterium]|nr:VanW family protein [Thermomicrobiales bacterium]